MLPLPAFIQFYQLSPYWLIPCFILGLVYAWLLYPKSLKSSSSTLEYLLAAFRVLLVFFLSALLLAPILQNKKETIEKPLLIIAQDNSASLKIAQPKGFNYANFYKSLQSLKTGLEKNYDVEVIHFGDGVAPGFDTSLSAKETDFSQLFAYINEQYGNRNIGAVVLASDGIINKGSSPVNDIVKSKIPIYTIALGDTIPKKDLLINNINYNNLVYLGNDYQLDISLSAFQLGGKTSQLQVRSNDGQLKSSSLKIEGESWRKNIKINLQAKTKGVQKITINLNPLDGEISKQNNQQIIYVEVIDGREKVLILADAPHPDLGALKQSIESSKTYEVDIAYADQSPKDYQKYGLVILHNLPSDKNSIRSVINQIQNKAKWYILGSQVNVPAFNQSQNMLTVGGDNANTNILPALNQDFFPFALTNTTKVFLNQLDPLSASAGSYSLKTASNNLLVRKDQSSAPVLAFFDQQGIKTAFLTGEGIWRWRLANYSKNENHLAFDELVTKTVQYLSAKDDKRKFRVYPAKEKFTSNQHVILNADLYNDAYEPITGAEIAIDIVAAKGKKYSYQFSAKDQVYELDAGILAAGEYNYVAKTKVGGKVLLAKGNFIVEELFAEYQQTVADHQLLYNLANLSNGKMLYPNEIDQLAKEIGANERIKTISYEDKTYEDLIDLKWVFAILITLLTLEWFLRKRNGLV